MSISPTSRNPNCNVGGGTNEQFPLAFGHLHNVSRSLTSDNLFPEVVLFGADTLIFFGVGTLIHSSRLK